MPVQGPKQSLRDTRNFYADGDPLRWVDGNLIAQIEKRARGKRLLDLGCGVGGYSRVLMDHGYDVVAFDVNPLYVEKARSLGVDARVFDGGVIPLDDDAVDTVFMIEVLEHVTQPQAVVEEIHRVARSNVVITVPNNTQRLNALISWSHMLDVDHKSFFDVDSLRALLSEWFSNVDVQQIVPADRSIAKDLGKWFYVAYRILAKLGFEDEKLFFRLIAEGSK